MQTTTASPPEVRGASPVHDEASTLLLLEFSLVIGTATIAVTASSTWVLSWLLT